MPNLQLLTASIAHEVNQPLSGILWATPNDGPGATFWLSIPSTQKVSQQRTGGVQ